MTGPLLEISLTIPPDQAGQRLGQALAALLPEHSRSRLKSWIESGEVRVDGAVRRPRDKVSGGESVQVAAMLPQETRRYVPRFFATLVILGDPARYGITLPEPLAPRPPTAAVRVERAVQLDRLDAELGLAVGTLKELNPALRHAATHATIHQRPDHPDFLSGKNHILPV